MLTISLSNTDFFLQRLSSVLHRAIDNSNIRKGLFKSLAFEKFQKEMFLLSIINKKRPQPLEFVGGTKR